MNYAESGGEEDEDDGFELPLPSRSRGRILKRRKPSATPDADEFIGDVESEADIADEGKLVE